MNFTNIMYYKSLFLVSSPFSVICTQTLHHVNCWRRALKQFDQHSYSLYIPKINEVENALDSDIHKPSVLYVWFYDWFLLFGHSCVEIRNIGVWVLSTFLMCWPLYKKMSKDYSVLIESILLKDHGHHCNRSIYRNLEIVPLNRKHKQVLGTLLRFLPSVLSDDPVVIHILSTGGILLFLVLVLQILF